MTEGYFPGSRVPLAPPGGLPEHLQIPDGSRTAVIGGREVELYRIGEVAEILNRTPVTLRKWERKGLIPKATFVLPSSDPRGKRRLYSRAQVEALYRVALEEKILHNPHAQITKTKFTQKIFAAFKELAAQ